ncbi:MAG: hypothetical protein ACR2NZ_24970, partial [Rubripirellula sp.]
GSPYSSWTVGVEDAESDISLPSSVPNARAVDRFPTVVSKWIYQHPKAHLEFAGIYRNLEAVGVGYESDVDAWGLWLSGWIETWGQDNVVFGSVIGEGLGAYADDTQGLGLDAAPRSSTNPALRAIPAHGFWLAYKHWWNASTRSTASYGYWKLQDGFDPTPNPVGTFQASQYVSANIIWSPFPSMDVGAEWLYGTRLVTARTAVDGSRDGDNHRLQVTVRWNTSHRCR